VTPARGAVATPHHAATRVGADVLAAGGTAVDAIVAANAMLCVVYPHMAGLGGDLFLLHHEAGSGHVACLNGSGPAPALATPEAFAERGLDAVPARGPLSLTVPGAVAAWQAALERHGSRPLAELLAPAVAAAEDGVAVTPRLAARIEAAREDLTGDPVLRRLVDAAGGRLRQPELASTLRRLASAGAEDFYRGEIAAGIDRAVAAAQGFLRRADLEGYAPEWGTPVRLRYRGLEVFATAPNSQGITALIMLNVLDALGAERMAPGSADHVEAMATAARIAYAARDRHVGDPEFAPVPVGRLLDPVLARDALAAPASVPPPRDVGGDTVYLAAVDARGNACSAIQSLFHAFGSAVVAGDTGILLHNRAHGFRLEPRHPNRLEPGKRPLHTLMASMALEQGRPRFLFGTMGGDAQPQINVAVLERLLRGEAPQEAVSAPRAVLGEDALRVEADLGDGVVAELERRGARLDVVPPRDERMGHAHAIALGRGGATGAGADPRSDGAAVLL
jgi:gamma-glutamyltranspeptidase